MPDTTNFINSTVSSQSARLEALQTLIGYMQFDAQSRRFPVLTSEYAVWITRAEHLRFADNQPQAYDGYRWIPIENETMQVWAERENVTLPEEPTVTNEPVENTPITPDVPPAAEPTDDELPPLDLTPIIPPYDSPLTPDEQRYVDGMRVASDDYSPFTKDEVDRLLAIIDRLTAPQPAAAPAIEAIEDIVVRGLNQWKTLRYGNLTKGQQIAADNLIARGEAVRIGDYIKSAPLPAVPPQPPAAPDGDVTAARDLLASISEPLTLTPADAAHFAAKGDWLDALSAKDDALNAELAAMGLRRASQLDGEEGYFALTSQGNVWATDLPASEKPAEPPRNAPPADARPKLTAALTDDERELLTRPYKTGRVNGGNAVHFISEYGTPLCGSGKSSHTHNFRRANAHYCNEPVTCKKCQQYGQRALEGR